MRCGTVGKKNSSHKCGRSVVAHQSSPHMIRLPLRPGILPHAAFEAVRMNCAYQSRLWFWCIWLWDEIQKADSGTNIPARTIENGKRLQEVPDSPWGACLTMSPVVQAPSRSTCTLRTCTRTLLKARRWTAMRQQSMGTRTQFDQFSQAGARRSAVRATSLRPVGTLLAALST